MAKLSGWQKVGVIAGVGCFSIVAVVVVGLAIAFAYARSTLSRLGDPTPTHVERAIALPAASPQPSTPAPAGESVSDRLRLHIDLEEGSFTIQPGPPGSEVRVTGDYAEALHELTESTETDAGGVRRTTIRFRGKAPAWARFIGGMGSGTGARPELTVTIPSGVPLDLSLRVAMAESRIDLGGLSVGDLGLDLSMGDHNVDFRAPVDGTIGRLRLDSRMGNVVVTNLGNAHATTIQSTGSMGNLRADLGGAWQPGGQAELSFDHSMGEVTVEVPSAVNVETSITSPQGSENLTMAADPPDPNAPSLRVRVNASMGEGRVRRY